MTCHRKHLQAKHLSPRWSSAERLEIMANKRQGVVAGVPTAGIRIIGCLCLWPGEGKWPNRVPGDVPGLDAGSRNSYQGVLGKNCWERARSLNPVGPGLNIDSTTFHGSRHWHDCRETKGLRRGEPRGKGQGIHQASGEGELTWLAPVWTSSCNSSSSYLSGEEPCVWDWPVLCGAGR
jgi:hypothetical protein